MLVRGKLWCQKGIQMTVVDPQGQSTSTHVHQPFARVGSHPQSDVLVPHSQAPELGLYLHATPEGIFWIRLDSTSQREQEASGWLAPEESLLMGTYRVYGTLAESDLPTTPTVGQAAGSRPDLSRRSLAAGESARLRIKRRGAEQVAEERLCCRRLTVVGRMPPAKIRLKHGKVSKVHCVLFWDRSALWVVDLLSANATYLEGQRVDAGRVHPKETLRLGDIEITYVGIGGSAPAEPDEGEVDNWTPPARVDSSDSTAAAVSQDTDVGFHGIEKANTLVELAGDLAAGSAAEPAPFPSQTAMNSLVRSSKKTELPSAEVPPARNRLQVELETHAASVEALRLQLNEAQQECHQLRQQTTAGAAREQQQQVELNRFADQQQALRRELDEARQEFQSQLETNLAQVAELRRCLSDAEKERDELRQHVATSSARERRQEEEFSQLSGELQKQSLRQLLLQEQIQSLTHVITRQSDQGSGQLLETENLAVRSVESGPSAQRKLLVVHPDVSPRRESRAEPGDRKPEDSELEDSELEDSELEGSELEGSEPEHSESEHSGPDYAERAAPPGREWQLASGRQSERTERPFAKMSATKEAVLPLGTDPQGQKDLKRLVDQLVVHHAKTGTTRRWRTILGVVSVGILLLIAIALLASLAWIPWDQLFFISE